MDGELWSSNPGVHSVIRCNFGGESAKRLTKPTDKFISTRSRAADTTDMILCAFYGQLLYAGLCHVFYSSSDFLKTHADCRRPNSHRLKVLSRRIFSAACHGTVRSHVSPRSHRMRRRAAPYGTACGVKAMTHSAVPYRCRAVQCRVQCERTLTRLKTRQFGHVNVVGVN